MASDQRNRVSDLYQAALQRAPDDRRAFLQQACAGDDVLRQDVESLLRYESGAVGSWKSPPRPSAPPRPAKETC